MDRNLSRSCTCSSTSSASMLRYTLRRLLGAAADLLVIVTLAFCCCTRTRRTIRFRKANPASRSEEYRSQVPLVSRDVAPVPAYLANLARGDLGPSFQYRSTRVTRSSPQGLPVVQPSPDRTALGSRSAARFASTPRCTVARAGITARWRAVAGISTPVFVVAPLLILIFRDQVALAARRRPGCAARPRTCCCRPWRWRCPIIAYGRAHHARRHHRCDEQRFHPQRPC